MIYTALYCNTITHHSPSCVVKKHLTEVTFACGSLFQLSLPPAVWSIVVWTFLSWGWLHSDNVINGKSSIVHMKLVGWCSFPIPQKSYIILCIRYIEPIQDRYQFTTYLRGSMPWSLIKSYGIACPSLFNREMWLQWWEQWGAPPPPLISFSWLPFRFWGALSASPLTDWLFFHCMWVLA